MLSSKEALQNIRDYHDETVIDNYCTCYENKFEKELEIIEKDLEILECFKKIPKQDLKDFIEWQIRYEKNMKTWLEERHFCYIGKEEEYTKHLIKIKEWLENENTN